MYQFIAALPFRFPRQVRDAFSRATLVIAVFLLTLMCGCGGSTPPVPNTAGGPTTNPVSNGPSIPPNRILVQFDTIGCVCQLGNVEIALLELPSVQSLDWEFDQYRVWLNFTDKRRPTDDEIRRALQYQNVTVKQIYRP